MGKTNAEQPAAFQAMWLQYDHLVAQARSDPHDLNNIVTTCGPCNFGRADYTLEEVDLMDPRARGPIRSRSDGLERFR